MTGRNRMGRRAAMLGGAAGSWVLLARHGRAGAEKPEYGGRLRVGYALAPGALAPATGRAGGDHYYWKPLADQLIDVDPVMTPRPERSLAESWDLSNPMAPLFRLRKGVRFHDGTPFGAAAVKFNLERTLDPATKATARAGFTSIDQVDAVDEHLVRLKLKRPWGSMFVQMADRGGAMSSPAAVRAHGADYAWKPSLTGPFKLAEVVSGSYVRMVRNEHYWGRDAAGNPLPYLDEVVVNMVPEATVQFAGLRAGELDLIWLPLKDVEAAAANPAINVRSYEGSGIALLVAYNMAKPPMDNMHLRLAIAHAVNSDVINRAVYNNRAIAAKGGMWPPNSPAFDTTVPRPTYNPAKAREHLRLGGRPNGFEIDCAWWASEYNSPAAEIFRAQLAAVGIKINAKTFDVTTVTEKFFYGNEFHIYLTPWTRRPDPDIVANQMYVSDGYYNAGKVKDQALDAMIEKAGSLTDMAQRLPLYRKIDEIVLGEARVTPLIYNVTYAGAAKRVMNLEEVFDYSAQMSLHRLWLRKR